MKSSPLVLLALALPCIVAIPASHADLDSLHLVKRGVLEERQRQRTTTTSSRRTTTTTSSSTTSRATTTRNTTTGGTTTTTTTTSLSTRTSPSSSSSTTSQSSLSLSSSGNSAVATTTTSTSTATISTVAIVTPSPLVCGVTGYSAGINSYNYAYNINASFAECHDHCLTYGPCVSFGFLPTTLGACGLFNVSAFSNLNPAISPWYFYDAACAAESPIINPFPTTTTTTATTTTKTIPTASPLCGVVGYNGPINAYFQFVDDSLTPYNDCSGECYYDSQCLSFAMNPSDTNHCYMYNATVEENVNPVPGSLFTFYDVWCPPPATTSTSSTMTSPSTPTTTI